MLGLPSPDSQEKTMQIRKFTGFALSLLVLALAPLSFGQFATQHTPHRQLGYYDPATGAFEPLHPSPDAELPPVTPTTGTLVFKFTLTVDTALAKNSVVGCAAAASVSDSSGFYSDERGSAIATLVSGKTYSCTVTMHYSWLLASPTTDEITMTYGSTVEYGYEATASNGTGTVVEPVELRGSDQALAPIKVPASGASTTETIAMTL
jgi:hypothetical protein